VSQDPFSFYITGGTMGQDAPSYVERQADQDLYDGLQRGEFCYVLTSRQMGKSSLMVRTAARLREEGVSVVVIDLTMLGRNLSLEQWYYGLLGYIGRQLDLRTELRDFWLKHDLLGPLQRWMAALREVVLPRWEGQFVIFVDEIDTVLSLPFSTDEFFAAIRECYNRRPEDPELQRLTFCLLGVATPSGLIQDTRTTPFNIGRRIELNDFTEAEAVPLAVGLALGEPGGRSRTQQEAKRLLRRILHWTRGHPYLTQRLCHAAAGDGDVNDARAVDRLCERLFFSAGARDRDDNLLFVRERMLRSEVDRASLLDMYGRIVRGRPVRHDETTPLLTVLRLAGVVRVIRGMLRVSNRIYERVFDQDWIRANLPDAEQRRQRAAYRRGLLRGAFLCTGVVAIMGALLLTAIVQARRAEQGHREVRRERYGAQMALGQTVLEAGDLDRLRELLEAQVPQHGEEDLRGFEWQYLWRHSGGGYPAFGREPYPVTDLLLLRNGTLVTGTGACIRFFDPASGRCVGSRQQRGRAFTSSCFSADGTLAATATAVNQRVGEPAERRWRAAAWTVQVQDLKTGRNVSTFKGRDTSIKALAFSRDGTLLAAASGDYNAPERPGEIWIWSVATGKRNPLTTGERRVASVAFSPDGRALAVGSLESGIRLLGVLNGREIARWRPAHGQPLSLAFSPDGTMLAAGCSTAGDPGAKGAVEVWDVRTHQRVMERSCRSAISTLQFSPGSDGLASGSEDGRILFWDPRKGPDGCLTSGHTGGVCSLAFSADGRSLASGGSDGVTRLWPAALRASPQIVDTGGEPVLAAAFASDGHTLAIAKPRSLEVWDSESLLHRRLLQVVADVACLSDNARIAVSSRGGQVTLHHLRDGTESRLPHSNGLSAAVTALAITPDGGRVAAGTLDGEITSWDTQRRVPTLVGRERRGIEVLAFTPDGGTLASLSDPGAIRLWDMLGRHAPRVVAAPKTARTSLRFSADGRYLAAGSGQDVWLHHFPTARASLLRGHSKAIVCLAFSPDGRTLVSAGRDSAARVWNLIIRQQVLSLPGAEQGNGAAAFSPDGTVLSLGGADGKVRLWAGGPGGAQLPRWDGTSVVESTVESPDAMKGITLQR
jgi:WD40 repeat protein